jgi:protein-disulfide isomerase
VRKAYRIAAVLALILAAPASAQEMGARSDLPLLERAHAARIFGADSPNVVLFEFIDYACSDCRAFQLARGDSLRALVEEDEGLALVVRAYPIPRLRRGFQAAEAAFCVAAYGGQAAFVRMTQRLFERQSEWSDLIDPTPFLMQYAETLGVPTADVRNCMERDAVWPIIISDARLGTQAAITGTPSFVFTKAGEYHGDLTLYGDTAIAAFRDAIAQVRARP